MVNSFLRFARIFIFNGKYKVPNFATDAKRRNVSGNQSARNRKIRKMKNICLILVVFFLISCSKEEKYDLHISTVNYNLNVESGEFNIDWYNNYKSNIIGCIADIGFCNNCISVEEVHSSGQLTLLFTEHIKVIGRLED